MSWVQTLAVVFHVLLAASIIGLVLIQRGKGADAGAGFGAGASGTVFGARGSGSFLSRATAILATFFFLTSLGLSYLFSQQTAPTSVVDRVQPTLPAPTSQPPPALLPSVPAETAPATGTAPAATQEPATTPAQAPAETPAQ
ncbi:MAG: preprotein translocase subunit SecG [Steroidobacteraceae bacterium]|nr:preprotein translocase subunit SecG [Steroidobacteraceae bacterium]